MRGNSIGCRIGFDLRTKGGWISLYRKDMFMYVGSWYQAVKLILHDSGWESINVKFK